MNDNVTNLFKPKPETPNKTMEESIAYFHDRLDKVLDDFQSLSVMEKWEVMCSLTDMNKTLVTLLMQEREKNRV